MARPVVNVRVEFKEWKRRTAIYAKELKLSWGEALRIQCRLLVERILSFTPPQKGQKQGEGAVARDINYIFKGANKTWIESMIEEHGGDYRAPHKTKDGRTYVIDTAMMRTDGSEMAEFHKAHRDDRGRVRNAQSKRQSVDIGRHTSRDTMIVPFEDLAAYLAKMKAKVGLLRAGWTSAALALGAKVPDYVARHGSGYSAIKDESKKTFTPEIWITNKVPFIQAQEEQNRIVANAIHSRKNAILPSIEKAHEKAKEKARI